MPDIEISNAPILGTSVGVENTYGALDGRTPAMPLTFGRISTDDPKGIIKAYIGEGELTNDPLATFGNRAVAQIPDLQKLMNYVCKNGFEHHVVMNASKTAGILKEAFDIVKGVGPYIIIGIAIGGLMHGFIPTGFFEAYISKENPFAVPIAVILGIPMYSNAAGVIPIIQVLVAKGVPLGTAIAFMMGVVGLSLPEAILLKKVMNWKLIAIYFGTIGFFMILSGYFFNMIL